MLFDQNDLKKGIDQIDESKRSKLEVVHFTANDFESPSSEESLIICGGDKHAFMSPVEFWLLSLKADHWSGREEYFRNYALSALCKPIDQTQFLKIVSEQTSRLRHSLPVPIEDKHISNPQMMYNDWDDVALLAELGNNYFSMHWETTA